MTLRVVLTVAEIALLVAVLCYFLKTLSLGARNAAGAIGSTQFSSQTMPGP